MPPSSLFQGLSAFPVTPADADGRVDTEALGVLIDRLVAPGVDSVTVLGSTGAYAYLDRRERARAVAAAHEALAGRLPLIAGVGALRTSWAQEMARDAEVAGADALLLAPMSYTPLTDEEVAGHFSAVAASTRLPLCIYNNPTATHFAFSGELISRLSHHPQIVAVKMPIPTDSDYAGEIGRLRSACIKGFTVGYSGDWGAGTALLSGADSWFSVIAGVLPQPAARLAQAAQAGDGAAVAIANQALEPFWSLFRAHGGLRVVYAITAALGLQVGEPPLPIRPIPADARRAVENALTALQRVMPEVVS